MEGVNSIPVTLGLEEIRRYLKTGNSKAADRLGHMLKMAEPLICARAAYKVSYIDAKYPEAVIVDGVRFTSKVLQKNLEEVGRVFPYVVTIGNALEEQASSLSDLLDKYFLDTIGTLAVVKARKYVEDLLRSKFGLHGLSFMSPGSLPGWPIEEQKPLFSLLGDVEGAIGVRLGESFLMSPIKSLSGFYFPTEIPFFNCQLCPRENCPSRKAQYSEILAMEYGIK